MPPPNLVRNGWEVYNILEEFRRQEVPKSNGKEDKETRKLMFRPVGCWSIKPPREICSTYPRCIMVPAYMTDDEVIKCAEFRKRGRLPALTYFYSTNKSSLWRSAQNKPGLKKNRSLHDESMIRKIGMTNPNNHQVVIFDARSKINAMANKFKQGGYEHMKYYTNCTIQFCNIDNIHAVRQAYKKTFILCNTPVDQNTFWTKIESYNWLNFVWKLMQGASDMAMALKEGKNVLVHCSDGWDRTAQLCSLVQLLLDPYYRTLAGFEVLIEKDWIKFGFQFELRSGHF